MPKAGTASQALDDSYYDRMYEQSSWYSHPWQGSPYLPVWMRIVDVLAANNASSIYEIGCGPGQLAGCLNQHLPKIAYAGIDFSPKAIEIARRKNAGKIPAEAFAVADMRDGEVFDRDFDTVIATEVFEHIDDDQGFIRRIPSGKLVIFSVPNFDDPAHVRYFSGYSDAARWYQPCFQELTVIWVRRLQTQYGYWIGVGRT